MFLVEGLSLFGGQKGSQGGFEEQVIFKMALSAWRGLKQEGKEKLKKKKVQSARTDCKASPNVC